MKNLMRILVSSSMFFSAFALANCTDDRYDLVLQNGRVMDPESNLDAIRNIGINDNKIVKITHKSIKGKEIVDVSGLVVAPSFIDLHAHGQNEIANRYQARDGVTTALEMELGAYNIEEWYAQRHGKTRLNYGATVSHLVTRASVLLNGTVNDNDIYEIMSNPDVAYATLSSEQVQKMLDQLAAGLDQGALGIGLGLQYSPGARRDEIYRVFKLAKSYDVPIFVHSRVSSIVEPDSIGALQELIANAVATNCALHFVHIGSSGGAQAPIMLEMINAAKENGVDITTEIYPYSAASTAIGSAIFSKGWRERMGVEYDALEWVSSGQRLSEKSFKQYRQEQPGGSVIVHFIPPEVVELGVSSPDVMIASDGGLWENNRGHPRGAGSFSRVLGLYVRDKKSLSLMSAIRKMSYLPAKRLENYTPMMKHKGRIKLGADADITIFDPTTVQDNATYADPMQFSTGIEHVLVGGKFIVRNMKLVDDVYPSEAIRK